MLISSSALQQKWTSPLMPSLRYSPNDSTGHIFVAYNGPLGFVAAGAWTVTLTLVLFVFGWTGVLSSFMAIGPNDEAKFGGAPVNTWGRWTALMIYSALSQLVQSLVEGTITPFVTNVIKDPCIDFANYGMAQTVVGDQNAFLWMVGLFDILLYITMQMQFWVPAIIADLAVNAALVHRNMLEKAHLESIEP